MCKAYDYVLNYGGGSVLGGASLGASLTGLPQGMIIGAICGVIAVLWSYSKVGDAE